MKAYDRIQNKRSIREELIDSPFHFFYWEDYWFDYEDYWPDYWYEDTYLEPRSPQYHEVHSKRNGIYSKIRLVLPVEIDSDSFLSKAGIRNKKIDQILGDSYSPNSLKNIAKF